MAHVRPTGDPPLTGPLIEAGELSRRSGDPRLRIADCRWYLGEPERGRAAYAEAHIPGAVYVDLEEHLSATSGPGRHPLPEPEALAATLGALGIGDEHEVVAYDDRGGAVAARLWWLLRHIGHGATRVLDGGLAAWQAAGLPVTDSLPDHPPAVLTPRRGGGATVDRSALRAVLGDVLLLDARAEERYRGEIEPIDPVAGHIPTARSAPYEDNLGEDHRFRSPADLRARYAALGAGPGADVVVYCGSGVTACHVILALEVAGFAGARLYPGSWSDWSASDLPVAVGTEPV